MDNLQEDDLGCFTVDQVRQRMGGMSRGSFYKLVKDGKLQAIKVGSRTLVTRRAMRRFLAEREAVSCS